MRLCGVLLIVALIAGVASAGLDTEDSVWMKRGDTNGDMVVDHSDPVFLQDFLFNGGPTPPCFDACDANDDGLVDNSDAIYLLNFFYQGGPMPPSPGPYSCGLDPTQDSLDCEVPSCPQ